MLVIANTPHLNNTRDNPILGLSLLIEYISFSKIEVSTRKTCHVYIAKFSHKLKVGKPLGH